MKNFNRKIKIALILCFVALIALVSFSKLGILFSNKDNLIITVSTPKNLLKPSKYMASLVEIAKEEETTTTEEDAGTAPRRIFR